MNGFLTGGVFGGPISEGGGGGSVIPYPMGRFAVQVRGKCGVAGETAETLDTRTDLLAEDQDRLGLPLLVPGHLVQWRVSLRDTQGLPLSLTDATLVLTLRENPASDTVLLERRTDEPIPDSVFAQIVHDADQAEEDTTNPAEPTGMSHATITFDETEEAVMRAFAGVIHFDLTAEWAPDAKPLLALMGQIQVVLNVTRLSQLP